MWAWLMFFSFLGSLGGGGGGINSMVKEVRHGMGIARRGPRGV